MNKLDDASTANERKAVITLGDGTRLTEQSDGCFRGFKLFFSVINEEKWLNYMALQGYELKERRVTGYCFGLNKAAKGNYFSVKYSVSSSTKDCLCDVTAEEAAGRAEKSSKIITTYCTKTYYKTPVGSASEQTDDFVPFEDAANKRRQMKYRFAFSFGLLCVFLGLLCYNLMYWIRFNAGWNYAKYSGGVLHDYKDKEHSLWEFTKDLSDKLGAFPCTPHISLFSLFTLLTIPFVIYYFDQYMYSRSFEKQLHRQWKRK